MLVALIMAGGSGQRFWPLSNEEHPKQLLKLFSDKTMIRETVDRILPLIPRNRIFIATNVKQEEEIRRELQFLPDENIIIEPQFKDTAACIGYAALNIKNKFEDAKMVVLPSDHLIGEKEEFLSMLSRGNELIEKDGRIAIFGIKPDKPETGYGYIEVDLDKDEAAMKVNRFREKPNLETAVEYLEAGNFYWNSGMFMWSVKTILDNIKEHMPDHWNVLQHIEDVFQYPDKDEQIDAAFEKFEKVSIDYGVMEKAADIVMLTAEIGWNDIGTFTALDEVFNHDENGTVVKKDMEVNVVEFESHDNIIINEGHKKIIATLGVENMVIVETDDVLLVCRKDEAQNIKELLKKVEGK